MYATLTHVRLAEVPNYASCHDIPVELDYSNVGHSAARAIH